MTISLTGGGVGVGAVLSDFAVALRITMNKVDDNKHGEPIQVGKQSSESWGQ